MPPLNLQTPNYHTLLSKTPREPLKRIPNQLPRIRRFHGGTLLYSSIFAAAALADADLKRVRREDLDDRLARGKEDLKKIEDSIKEKSERILRIGAHTRNIEHIFERETSETLAAQKAASSKDDLAKLEACVRRERDVRSQNKIQNDALGGPSERVVLGSLFSRASPPDFARGGNSTIKYDKARIRNSQQRSITATYRSGNSTSMQAIPHAFAPEDVVTNSVPATAEYKDGQILHPEQFDETWLDSKTRANSSPTRMRISQTGDNRITSPSLHILEASKAIMDDGPMNSERPAQESNLDDDYLNSILTPEVFASPKQASKTHHPFEPPETDYLESLLQHVPFTKTTVPPQIPTVSPVWVSSIRLPPQSPWARSNWSARLHPPVWCAKKISRVSVCVTRFVTRLSLLLRLSDLSPDAIASLPASVRPFALLHDRDLTKQWKNMEQYFIALQYKDPHDVTLPILKVSLPSYSIGTDDLIHAFNTRMTKTLARRTTVNTIQSASLIELCDDLLTSPCHPDIHTINILLNTFNRTKRQDLTDLVIEIFFDGCFRPNEITCAEILKSYRGRGDSNKFLEFVSLIRGFRSGLMTACPAVNCPDPVLDAVVHRQPGDKKLIQAMQPSPVIYVEMINGLLKFLGLHDTMQICKNLWDFGWGWSYACMHQLLLYCAVQSEWQIGLQIWSVAEELSSRGHPMPKKLYARQLAMCRLTHDDARFQTILHRSLNNPPISSDNMMRLVRSEEARIQSRRHQFYPCT